MRLGLMVEGQEGMTWERWRSIARAAEDLGFDSLWRSDHFFSLFGDRHQPSLETWVSLAQVAQETRRIRFGPLVCSMTFRHPAHLARMAAQVDILSGGRLEVGIGAGWNVSEHQAFGLPFPPTSTRFDMLEEGIQVMRALWGDGPANFKGRHYELHDAECYPKPAQSPLPIVVGGVGERRTLRIAALYAGHWNAISVNPEGYAGKREVLERHCADVGRDPNEIHRSFMAGFAIGRDASELRAHVGRIAAGMPAVMGDPDTLVGRLKRDFGWPVGTPDEVVEQIHAYEEAGVQEFMLQHHDQADMKVLELIAAKVMPQVRRA